MNVLEGNPAVGRAVGDNEGVGTRSDPQKTYQAMEGVFARLRGLDRPLVVIRKSGASLDELLGND